MEEELPDDLVDEQVPDDLVDSNQEPPPMLADGVDQTEGTGERLMRPAPPPGMGDRRAALEQALDNPQQAQYRREGRDTRGMSAADRASYDMQHQASVEQTRAAQQAARRAELERSIASRQAAAESARATARQAQESGADLSQEQLAALPTSQQEYADWFKSLTPTSAGLAGAAVNFGNTASFGLMDEAAGLAGAISSRGQQNALPFADEYRRGQQQVSNLQKAVSADPLLSGSNDAGQVSEKNLLAHPIDTISQNLDPRQWGPATIGTALAAPLAAPRAAASVFGRMGQAVGMGALGGLGAAEPVQGDVIANIGNTAASTALGAGLGLAGGAASELVGAGLNKISPANLARYGAEAPTRVASRNIRAATGMQLTPKQTQVPGLPSAVAEATTPLRGVSDTDLFRATQGRLYGEQEALKSSLNAALNDVRPFAVAGIPDPRLRAFIAEQSGGKPMVAMSELQAMQDAAHQAGVYGDLTNFMEANMPADIAPQWRTASATRMALRGATPPSERAGSLGQTVRGIGRAAVSSKLGSPFGVASGIHEAMSATTGGSPWQARTNAIQALGEWASAAGNNPAYSMFEGLRPYLRQLQPAAQKGALPATIQTLSQQDPQFRQLYQQAQDEIRETEQ